PGGVDEYLRLIDDEDGVVGANKNDAGSGAASVGASRGQQSEPGRQSGAGPHSNASALSGAQRHALGKEANALERRLEKLAAQIEQLQTQMGEHDPGD